MCQQIVQFCSDSARLLLFAGGLLSLLSAICLGYIGWTLNAIYSGISPKLADPLNYYFQLAAVGYLILVTLLSCYAAYCDQKHSIRALSGVASVNFILALVAIVFLARNGNSTEAIGYLEDAKTLYDFKDGNHNSTTLSLVSSTSPTNNSQMQNRTMRRKRWTPEENMNKTVATQIWDGLQARGCCGLKNETYWEQKYPKSCCAKPIPSDDEIRCEKTGVYQEGCERLINSYELNRMIVLAFVALVNLYLATTSGISAYKTYDYAQANQNVLS